MDIGKKIYELRKLNNITQEQLAKALGVSTPAVCKWETGVSMPDITLLTPIARMLRTNLDELLSFEEYLSEEKIQEIMKNIMEKCKEKGINSAIKLSLEYLHEYPNNEELKLRIAMSPSLLSLHAYRIENINIYEDDSYKYYFKECTKMLEELVDSKTDSIRYAAIGGLIGQYMNSGRLDDAKALIDKLPKQDLGADYILPNIYMLKKDYDNSLLYAQKNTQKDVNRLLLDIRAQHTVYLERKEYDKALKCAKDYLQLAKMINVPGNELLIDTYLAMDKLELAKKCFLEYLDEIRIQSIDYEQPFYLSELSSLQTPELRKQLKESGLVILKLFADTKKYNELMQIKEVQDEIKELEKILLK